MNDASSAIYRKPIGEDLTIDALSAMENPWEQLLPLVDFEMLRHTLEDSLSKNDCKSTTNRPQFDVVLIFKVIFLQNYYCLGDKQIKYQIICHTSFHKFLGIHTVDEVPDEKMVWHVRDVLSKVKIIYNERLRCYFLAGKASIYKGKNCLAISSVWSYAMDSPKAYDNAFKNFYGKYFLSLTNCTRLKLLHFFIQFFMYIADGNRFFAERHEELAVAVLPYYITFVTL